MKFRARMSVASALERMLSALDKVAGSSEDSVLVMSPDHWSFRVSPSSGAAAGVFSFCEIPTKVVFEKYRIASSIDGNRICLMVDIGNLVRALKSAHGLVKVLVALVKRDDAVSLEFSITGEAISLVQNVPVQIGNLRSIEDSAEPQVPEPLVKFYMPDLKYLKTIADRMKSLSSAVSIRVTSNGEFSIQARTDIATAKALFNGLQLSDDPNGNVVSSEFGIELKHLIRVLSCSFLESTVAIGCIVEEHCFVIHIDVGADFGSLTYYIPILNEA